MVDVAIVIVSYNVAPLLRECLKTVYASRDVSFQVCVVDNHSQDDSVAMVRREFPEAIRIENPTNGGYAYANNRGLERLLGPSTDENAAPPRYVLLLNPDTELPPYALQHMVAFMDAHPKIGVVGPKLVRPDGSLDLACRRSFPTPSVSFYRMMGLSRLFPRSRRFARYNLTFLDPNTPSEVDSVVGAFMMVRTEVIRQVGLLDEAFFLYGEDLDWAYRIKERGWQVFYNPAVVVLHHKGESSRGESLLVTREFYRAMWVFFQKHYAPQTFFLWRWLIFSAIFFRGGLAYLMNLIRPANKRGVH